MLRVSGQSRTNRERIREMETTEHVCWVDDTLCDECGGAVDIRQVMLNYITVVDRTFGLSKYGRK